MGGPRAPCFAPPGAKPGFLVKHRVLDITPPFEGVVNPKGSGEKSDHFGAEDVRRPFVVLFAASGSFWLVEREGEVSEHSVCFSTCPDRKMDKGWDGPPAHREQLQDWSKRPGF